MKHIMVNDRVYLVSDEIYGKIVAAFTLANTTDGDMSNIIDTVEKYGKLVGTVLNGFRLPNIKEAYCTS